MFTKYMYIICVCVSENMKIGRIHRYTTLYCDLTQYQNQYGGKKSEHIYPNSTIILILSCSSKEDSKFEFKSDI